MLNKKRKEHTSIIGGSLAGCASLSFGERRSIDIGLTSQPRTILIPTHSIKLERPSLPWGRAWDVLQSSHLSILVFWMSTHLWNRHAYIIGATDIKWSLDGKDAYKLPWPRISDGFNDPITTAWLDNRFCYRDEHELLSIFLLSYSCLISLLFSCKFIPPFHHRWLHSLWFLGVLRDYEHPSPFSPLHHFMATLSVNPRCIKRLWAFCPLISFIMSCDKTKLIREINNNHASP